jgi:hypothetical protein
MKCKYCGNEIHIFVKDPVLQFNEYPFCTNCNSIVEVELDDESKEE